MGLVAETRKLPNPWQGGELRTFDPRGSFRFRALLGEGRDSWPKN